MKKNGLSRQTRSAAVGKKDAIRKARESGVPMRGRALPMRLIDHLMKVLDRMAPFDAPADVLLSHYFRSHPQLGAGDRKWIAEAAFNWLRYRPRILRMAEEGTGPILMRWAQLSLVMVGAPEWAWAVGGKDQCAWISKALQGRGEGWPQEARTCMPDWLWERLQAQMGRQEAGYFSEAVNQAAPLDIRVNRIQATVDQVEVLLQAENQPYEPIEGLPDGLRLLRKPVVAQWDAFKQGWFEVQDAGSQWIATLTAPRRGDLVIDMCAGAGGKTLALGALMKNTGRLLAVDTSETRLTKLKPRMARSGLSNVYSMAIDHENDPRLDKYRNKADRVLVDAPCSGLGTLRRNPDLKWRQSPESVAELGVKQASILEAAAQLVKPDGRLVYATCSVLKEENEAIVEAFLAAHPEFRVRHWTEVLPPKGRPQGLISEPDVPYVRLWPHKHDSDGFFVAVLQKEARKED